MNRISKDEYYLNVAESISKRSTCLRRQYGAVIVNDDEIVSTGYNGSPRSEVNCIDCGECLRNTLKIPKGERYEICRAVHAEQNAIISASRKEMAGGTIYIVGKESNGTYADPSPCLLCRRFIVNAGITRCVGLINGKPTEIDISTASETVQINKLIENIKS